jgi:hypothetical protein
MGLRHLDGGQRGRRKRKRGDDKDEEQEPFHVGVAAGNR